MKLSMLSAICAATLVASACALPHTANEGHHGDPAANTDGSGTGHHATEIEREYGVSACCCAERAAPPLRTPPLPPLVLPLLETLLKC